MKITSGGTIGFKIIAKPYEPISVSATFTYETERPLNDEEIAALNEKVNKTLEEQLKKKANVAVKVYKEARARLASIVDK